MACMPEIGGGGSLSSETDDPIFASGQPHYLVLLVRLWARGPTYYSPEQAPPETPAAASSWKSDVDPSMLEMSRGMRRKKCVAEMCA